ncbi:MAG: hypothetical protein DME57_02985 [Verrucomicrobia bacterium]|nr:MAG: hypothetical protein DME57_02985 [Verrucomicrobiota bacterium]
MKLRLTSLAFVLLALAACKRESEIKVYRVSKAPLEEPEAGPNAAMPANAPSPSMPGGMGMGTATTARDSTTPQIKWTKPETWSDVPPSSMRYAGDNNCNCRR